MLELFSLNLGTLLQIIIAGFLGAFIGLEREVPRIKARKMPTAFGGIRSFALIAMIGALTTWFDAKFGGQIFILLGFIAVFILVLVVHVYTTFKSGYLGITTELAAIFVYFLGVLTMLGGIKFALVLTVVLAIIMSAKSYSETLKVSVSRMEVVTTLKFATIAFIVLPLLPDVKYSFATLLETLGFTEAILWENVIWQMKFFNPYSIWFFVVTMSSVSYVGYILSRIFGKGKSVLLSSAIGGLISSTAVTATMSEQSRGDVKNSRLYVVGTLIANCIMFLRVILIVLLFNFALLPVFIFPAMIMFVALVLATIYFAWTSRHETASHQVHIEEKVQSPFSALPAFKFGAFVLGIKFIAGIGLIYKDIWGEKLFYYALGIMSGCADVDAITQTMTVQSKEGLLASAIATSTILIAVMSNNTVKASIAYKFGERQYGKNVMLSFLFSMVMGIIGIIITNTIG